MKPVIRWCDGAARRRQVPHPRRTVAHDGSGYAAEVAGPAITNYEEYVSSQRQRVLSAQTLRSTKQAPKHLPRGRLWDLWDALDQADALVRR